MKKDIGREWQNMRWRVRIRLFQLVLLAFFAMHGIPMTTSFALLPLHDATIRSIVIDWSEKRCTIDCATLTGPSRIQFTGLSSIRMSFNDEWGPSSSILCQQQLSDVYRIEVQSGDTIDIVASGFIFN